MALSGNMEYTFRTAHDDNDFTNPWARAWGPSRRDHEVQSRFRVRMPETVRVTHPLLRAIARATYENTTFNFRFRANSGRLYSIVSGRDLNGDQSTRDRPPGVARNTETGPGSWTLDMTLTKDVPLSGGTGADRDGEDGRAGDGGRRGRSSSGDGPRLRFQARVNNLLNETHPRGYGSVVTSSLFGLPTGYTRGRTISMSLGLRF